MLCICRWAAALDVDVVVRMDDQYAVGPERALDHVFTKLALEVRLVWATLRYPCSYSHLDERGGGSKKEVSS